MKEPHLQLGITPRRLPGSQLSNNHDVIGRLLMICIEKIEAASITDERLISMKEFTIQVATEIMELWNRASLPNRAYSHMLGEVRKLWGKKTK